MGIGDVSHMTSDSRLEDRSQYRKNCNILPFPFLSEFCFQPIFTHQFSHFNDYAIASLCFENFNQYCVHHDFALDEINENSMHSENTILSQYIRLTDKFIRIFKDSFSAIVWTITEGLQVNIKQLIHSINMSAYCLLKVPFILGTEDAEMKDPVTSFK